MHIKNTNNEHFRNKHTQTCSRYGDDRDHSAFGIIGYAYLGVREYPSVDNPIISVTCSYAGANADVIENQITEPLEQNINGIPGIRSLTSTSEQGKAA